MYAVGVMFFLLLRHPELLSYHEQYQLFLFNTDYLLSKLSVAGGIADYVSEFFVQFCYIPFAGALVFTLIFVIMQQLMYRLCRRVSSSEMSYPLSIVPGLLLLAYMGDENVLLSFAVALIFVMLAVLAVLNTNGKRRVITEMLVIPLLYWSAGPVVFCYVILMIICSVICDRLSTYTMIAALLRAVCTVVVVYVSYKFILTQYIANDVWLGINYHRNRLTYPTMQFVVESAIVIMPLLAHLFLYVKIKRFDIVLSGVLLLGGSVLVVSSYDKDKFTQLYFDYCVRNQQWDDIVERAEKHMPRSALACNSVNLALAKTGQLGERMFDFYQCGSEGLLSRFARNMVSCVPTAEIYYHLGMVNESLRCYFDSQEAILNYQKSGRMTQRIAEMYMVNGDYEVARKFLTDLQETLFYSSWANEMLNLIGDEQAIMKHPTLGMLRKCRYDDKFFFSFDTNNMLVRLWDHNKANELALEYLMANIMLTCDMKSFYNMSSVLAKRGYNSLPKHYREVVAMFALQGVSLGEALKLDKEMVKRVKDFDAAFLMNPDRTKMLKGKWRNTYWTYCLVTYPSLNATTGATRIKH